VIMLENNQIGHSSYHMNDDVQTAENG